MATASAAWTVHNTLSTTTVDVITLTGGVKDVTVTNWAAAGGVDMYVTYSNTGTAPTDPVAAADDTYKVPPGGFITFPGRAGVIVKIIGNANAYSIEGYGNR
jgi:hypothetical protein